jgi:putative peptidoglycan lipid II flippase
MPANPSLKNLTNDLLPNEIKKPFAIGSTVLLMTLLTLIGQCLAVVRESTIAAKFGASSLTDAFILAIVIPNAILLLVQNGILMAFVPMFAQTLTERGEEMAWQLGCSLLNGSLMITVVLSMLIFVGVQQIVSFLAPVLSNENHTLTTQMLRLLIPVSFSGP